MLPGDDGLTVLPKHRNASITTPAIFLTARAEISDRIAELDVGADDDLVKPFSFAELLARIRVALYRGPDQTIRTLSIADLSVDLAARSVIRAGTRIELTAKEFAILEYLMVNAGHVLNQLHDPATRLGF